LTSIHEVLNFGTRDGFQEHLPISNKVPLPLVVHPQHDMNILQSLSYHLDVIQSLYPRHFPCIGCRQCWDGGLEGIYVFLSAKKEPEPVRLRALTGAKKRRNEENEILWDCLGRGGLVRPGVGK
jgi:hypothetical protein